jgi:hypothetical protein
MQRKRTRARHVPGREAGQHLQWAVTHSPVPLRGGGSMHDSDR